MIYIFVTLLAVFFALNMGGATFAACFAAAYGGKIIRQKKAGALFIIFVILGSLCLGKNVSITLGRDLVPSVLIGAKAIAVIFFSAGISMFASNLMKIPQSTSLVTVAAISGVGVYYGRLNLNTLYYMIPFWVVLPIISYVLTHLITEFIYPPRRTNFWVYERFINHQGKLKAFVVIVACYNAFAIGTNNVANVVGPLMGSAGVFTLRDLLLFFAFIYGVGPFIFTEPIKTVSQKVIPLGLLTASVISLVSGSLMILASVAGVPQSFVMLKMGAIFAVSSLKDGHEMTFSRPLTRRTLYTWMINPIITFLMSLGLSYIVLA